MDDSEVLQLGLSSDQWRRVREALQRAHWIVVTNQGDFVLCRDLHKEKVGQLVSLLDLPTLVPTGSDGLQKLPWYPSFAQRLEAIDQYAEEQLDITLAEVFDSTSEETGEVASSTVKRATG